MPPPGSKLKIGAAMTEVLSAKKKSGFSPASEVLRKLGLETENPGAFCGEWLGSGKSLESISPIDGRLLANVRTASLEDYEGTIQHTERAFHAWQTVPAPKRGEIVRQLGNALREAK